MASNVFIVPKRNEPIDKALKRFTRKMDKAEVLDIYNDHLTYEKPSERRRRKAKAARFKK
ncbi:30S ribosomal protein S21 [Acinetobacter sp.]|uniref:30S ribosomal protein S21 n=1 Tax=Acinetobacter sp. TaxID=472 RepID=UPI003D03D9FF